MVTFCFVCTLGIGERMPRASDEAQVRSDGSLPSVVPAHELKVRPSVGGRSGETACQQQVSNVGLSRNYQCQF